MPYAEEDLLPISALQHLVFCPRQCALIHLERAWIENRYTAEGRVMHERVHQQDKEKRKDRIIARGLFLRSLEHGIVGISDVVEFLAINDTRQENPGVQIPGNKGLWRPFPVEYKRGKRKNDGCDEVQLCAQAFCLEEAFLTNVPKGALYYGRNKRRLDVDFDESLRRKTKGNINRLHTLLAKDGLPQPESGPKCRNCSLREICMPEIFDRELNASQYIKTKIKENIGHEK